MCKECFSKIPSDLLSGNIKPSKREFLSLMMSVFDPLDFLNPIVVLARLIFEDICREGNHWNERICAQEFILSKTWLDVFPKIVCTKGVINHLKTSVVRSFLAIHFYKNLLNTLE